MILGSAETMCSVVVDADNALGCRTVTSNLKIRHIVSEKFGIGMIGGEILPMMKKVLFLTFYQGRNGTFYLVILMD